MRTHSRIIIAHHLIFTNYGHWLPNDPRGSGSVEIRKNDLETLGAIHYGRKRIQPPRQELKQFYRQAEPLLQHKLFWFDNAKRQALGSAVEQAARELRYTLYAFASCGNHSHALVRRHRDDAVTIWSSIADYTRRALQAFDDLGAEHPIWSARPYAVFCYTPDDIRSRIKYINDNPPREGLPPQTWPFVKPYDGWPHPRPPR